MSDETSVLLFLLGWVVVILVAIEGTSEPTLRRPKLPKMIVRRSEFPDV
jgi:hypothetical protein